MEYGELDFSQIKLGHSKTLWNAARICLWYYLSAEIINDSSIVFNTYPSCSKKVCISIILATIHSLIDALSIKCCWNGVHKDAILHYIDVIMSTMASQITSVSVGCSNRSGADKNKNKTKTGFVRVNSPHKGPVTQKMFPFDDVIMNTSILWCRWC